MEVVECKPAIILNDAEALCRAVEIGVKNSQRSELAVDLVGCEQNGASDRTDRTYVALGWHINHVVLTRRVPAKVWHTPCCNLISPLATCNLTVGKQLEFRHRRHKGIRFT